MEISHKAVKFEQLLSKVFMHRTTHLVNILAQMWTGSQGAKKQRGLGTCHTDTISYWWGLRFPSPRHEGLNVQAACKGSTDVCLKSHNMRRKLTSQRHYNNYIQTWRSSMAITA